MWTRRNNYAFIISYLCLFSEVSFLRYVRIPLVIINSTKEGIVILFQSKKGNAILRYKSSPGVTVNIKKKFGPRKTGFFKSSRMTDVLFDYYFTASYPGALM